MAVSVFHCVFLAHPIPVRINMIAYSLANRSVINGLYSVPDGEFVSRVFFGPHDAMPSPSITKSRPLGTASSVCVQAGFFSYLMSTHPCC